MRRGFYVLVFACLLSVVRLGAAPSHHHRPTVESTYDALSSRTLPERKAYFRTLDAEMQRDVWVVHLERFLEAHPALTSAQVKVLATGIGLIASGVVGWTNSSPIAEETRWEALREFENDVRVEFSGPYAYAAFFQLGGPDDVDVPRARFAPATTQFFIPSKECECSTRSNWCGGFSDPTYPLPYCKAGACKNMSGCGTFWQYTCDGLCSATP